MHDKDIVTDTDTSEKDGAPADIFTGDTDTHTDSTSQALLHDKEASLEQSTTEHVGMSEDVPLIHLKNPPLGIPPEAFMHEHDDLAGVTLESLMHDHDSE